MILARRLLVAVVMLAALAIAVVGALAALRAAAPPVPIGGEPAAPVVDQPVRDLDELRTRIAAVLVREGVPGAGIALVDGERVVWAGGVGFADLAAARPVTADTLFRAGSITKGFVALALIKLAEQGRADLRAPVRRLAPEIQIGNLWEAEQPITVAHLLEHTAGFDDMRPNELYAPAGAESLPLAEMLARNPRSRIARWRPGSRFSYANPGYTVAGYLIEKVTGSDYEDVIARELFAPLGMTGAALRLTPEVAARLASGYGDGVEPVPYATLYHRPAGNLMVSPRELAALVQLALGRGRFAGKQLISPAGWERFEHGETAWLDSGDARYGLGVMGDPTERALIRGHDGGIDGFVSMYGYLPGQHAGYVLLVNSTRSMRAMIEIRHLLVEYLLAGKSVPAPPPRVRVPEVELARWVGSYHAAAPRSQLAAFVERLQPGVELFVDGGRLYVRPLPGDADPVELIPLGGDQFRVAWASGSHIALGHDREGRRILVASNQYLVEEPRARVVGYAGAPAVVLSVLLFGPVLLIMMLRIGVRWRALIWPAGVSAATFLVPSWFVQAAELHGLGERNAYTVGIFALTLVFAAGAAGSMVGAILALGRPGEWIVKLSRLLFGAAACLATAYLAAYGIIGIQLWDY